MVRDDRTGPVATPDHLERAVLPGDVGERDPRDGLLGSLRPRLEIRRVLVPRHRHQGRAGRLRADVPDRVSGNVRTDQVLDDIEQLRRRP